MVLPEPHASSCRFDCLEPLSISCRCCQQVSFRALARSPGLAAAARAELRARQHTGRIVTDDGTEASCACCCWYLC